MCKNCVTFEGNEFEWCNVFENFELTIPIIPNKPKQFNLYEKIQS